MTTSAPLHLAVELDGRGAHPGAHLVDGPPLTRAAWPDDAESGDVGPARLRRAVAAAQEAGVTFVTFDDSLTPPTTGPGLRLDAVTRAAHVAPTTSRIGLVPLVHPAVTEPFHVAAQIASLDHASRGRAGWLVGTGDVPGARAALDRPVAVGDDLRAETADVARVLAALWDSWEDDAVVRDTATGRYVDRERLHRVDFVSGGTGPTASPASRDVPDGVRAPFSVVGPLIVPRGPQGRPVVVARAGVLPGDQVDVALVGPGAADDPHLTAATLGASWVARAAQDARAAGAPRVLLDLAVVLDTADATAWERADELDGAAAPAPGSAWSSSARWTGPAAGLTELLLALRGVVDGVRLLPAVQDVDLAVVVRDVVPPLRVARAVPTPRPGATLRDTLGLERPAHQFARGA